MEKRLGIRNDGNIRQIEVLVGRRQCPGAGFKKRLELESFPIVCENFLKIYWTRQFQCCKQAIIQEPKHVFHEP